MGIFENLIKEIGKLQETVINLSDKLEELKVQTEAEEVWQRKDIENFTGFKYLSVKELTNRSDFPKFYIGKTECYMKSEVINYLKYISKPEKLANPTKKNTTSSLYTIK